MHSHMSQKRWKNPLDFEMFFVYSIIDLFTLSQDFEFGFLYKKIQCVAGSIVVKPITVEPIRV